MNSEKSKNIYIRRSYRQSPLRPPTAIPINEKEQKNYKYLYICYFIISTNQKFLA